ncbi:hypothetical protein HaLaN_03957 [Haematococcus lacustris]|uniref:F-box domain-containing protein n=1 Tax=Haematococcus lacustris TaxID=44745 RepID=A0A699YFT2_HAELA|nr:hypothetical protein HaLaN_03957 [Haematococcus lacustris]
MDGNIKYVTIHLRQASTVEDNIELFARSSIRSTSLSLSRPYGPGSAEVASELSSALSIPSRKHLAALQAVMELHLWSLQVPLHLSMALAAIFRRLENLSFSHCELHHLSRHAWQRLKQLSCLKLRGTVKSAGGSTDASAQPRLGGLQFIRGLTTLKLDTVKVVNSSLAACTQLTRLGGPSAFPGLSQLTQLCRVRIHKISSLSNVAALTSLPHLAHLKLDFWVSSDQLGSSQRFMFPSLERLELWEVKASYLAAMDCPQLQHMEIGIDFDRATPGLVVDSALGLRACADGILHHCNFVELTRSPDVTLTAMLEALAPWQPSAAALSSTRWGMGLRLDNEKQISASHLELLPTGLHNLTFTGCTLLPGALHPVATRLTQLRVLNLQDASDCSAEDLQLLACQSVQGRRLTVHLDRSSEDEFASSLQGLSDMAGRWSGRPGPRFEASYFVPGVKL